MAAIAVLAALTAAIVFAAIVTTQRRSIFWFAFIAPLVPIAYIDRYHFDLPALVKWAPFLVVAVAAGAALLLSDRRARLELPSGLVVGYGAILAVSLLSVLLNGSGWPAFAVAQRGYATLFFCVVAIFSARRIYGRDQVMSFLVWAGLVSAVICVLQRVFVVPGVAGPYGGDRVTGLFSVGFITLFFHLCCIGIAVAYWLQGRRVVKLPPLMVVGTLVLGIAVANQKAALFYLVVMLGFTVLRSSNARVKRNAFKLAAASVALPGLLFVVFTAIYDSAYERGTASSYSRMITEPDYLKRYLFGEGERRFTPAGRLLRGSAVVFAWEQVATDPAHLLLGRGPGATSESRMPGASGRIARAYPGYAVDRVSLSMILAEIGVLGLLASLGFLLAIRASANSGIGTRPEHRQATEFFVVLAVLYSVYGNMLYEPIFGLLAASMVFPVAERARSRVEAPPAAWPRILSPAARAQALGPGARG